MSDRPASFILRWWRRPVDAPRPPLAARARWVVVGLVSALTAMLIAATPASASVLPLNAPLGPGSTLYAGEYATSESGNYYLIMQGDGNLVQYDRYGNWYFESGTQGYGNRVAMQGDGNLVMYSPSNRVLWSSDTWSPGAFLKIQDDGKLMIYTGGAWAVPIAWACIDQVPGNVAYPFCKL